MKQNKAKKNTTAKNETKLHGKRGIYTYIMIANAPILERKSILEDGEVKKKIYEEVEEKCEANKRLAAN